MTIQQLEQVIERLRQLPEDQQAAMAAIIEEELDDEARWRNLLASPRSQSWLEQMARKAIEDDQAGRTRPLEDLL